MAVDLVRADPALRSAKWLSVAVAQRERALVSSAASSLYVHSHKADWHLTPAWALPQVPVSQELAVGQDVPGVSLSLLGALVGGGVRLRPGSQLGAISPLSRRDLSPRPCL